MIRCILIIAISLMMCAESTADDLVERAEASDLRFTSGKTVSRVERDDERRVIRLKLNNFTLLPSDIAEIAAQKHLRSIFLLGTNVSDSDVATLMRCENLEHLNLTNTDVTDAAISSILQMKKLKSVCLGNVRISPDGIERLKAMNRGRGKDQIPYLRWGYSQRKQDAAK